MSSERLYGISLRPIFKGFIKLTGNQGHKQILSEHQQFHHFNHNNLHDPVTGVSNHRIPAETPKHDILCQGSKIVSANANIFVLKLLILLVPYIVESNFNKP